MTWIFAIRALELKSSVCWNIQILIPSLSVIEEIFLKLHAIITDSSLRNNADPYLVDFRPGMLRSRHLNYRDPRYFFHSKHFSKYTIIPELSSLVSSISIPLAWHLKCLVYFSSLSRLGWRFYRIKRSHSSISTSPTLATSQQWPLRAISLSCGFQRNS